MITVWMSLQALNLSSTNLSTDGTVCAQQMQGSRVQQTTLAKETGTSRRQGQCRYLELLLRLCLLKFIWYSQWTPGRPSPNPITTTALILLHTEDLITLSKSTWPEPAYLTLAKIRQARPSQMVHANARDWSLLTKFFCGMCHPEQAQ